MRRQLLRVVTAVAGVLAVLALATLPAAGSSGSPGEGSSSNGDGSNGNPSNGSPSNGDPSNGNPSNGDPSNGNPSNGDPSNGNPSNGNPSNGDGSSCPSSNPPNEMQLIAGSPQSALLGGSFVANLQVALVNSNGCAVTGVAGTAVRFTAPGSGASGTFAGSGASAVMVGADAQGDATAPTFSANLLAGSYAVTAVSAYGSVSFALTNSAAGVPAKLVAVTPLRSSARVLGRYARPLAVRVLDANGAPLAGVSISFAISAVAGTNACGAAQSAGAAFVGAATQATASTNAAGIASSPPLLANASAGAFSAIAALSSSAGGNSTSPSASSTLAQLAFSLKNTPGKPLKLTAGVGASQSASLGERFPIPLAVTVTDMQKNPVPGALVRFTAPADGASGSFRSHGRRVQVRSNACGLAIAPAFSANGSVGGYVVRASLAHLRAAFGLVNRSG